MLGVRSLAMSAPRMPITNGIDATRLVSAAHDRAQLVILAYESGFLRPGTPSDALP